MEYLPGGLTLELPQGCFPLSTDSMALAHFAKIPKNARILDLGAGAGTLGLLLCAKDGGCHVTGVELEPSTHQAALHNIARNNLGDRMESICADLRSVSGMFSPGSFSLCVSNPPYFSGGPVSEKYPTARREDSCSPTQLFAAAGWGLKFGGDFCLVHKPERLAELICQGAKAGMECKRLGLLRHREGGPVNLALLSFRKGAKPGLILEDWILHHADGSPTALYNEIYHLGG